MKKMNLRIADLRRKKKITRKELADAMEAHWRTELEQQGRDYAVAIRTAHMMQKLGLKDVDVRMKDKVAFVTPAQADYEQTKRDFLEYNDWNAGYTFAKGTMISYGKK